MKHRILHIAFILSLVLTKLNGQVEVHDTGFGQFLCDSFPSVISSDCKTLDTIQAELITASLNFNNRDIDSIPEIKYFTGTAFIDGENNNFKHYPEFTAQHNFDRLEFSWNHLTTLPDVAERESEIIGLWLNRNEITSIEGLEKYTILRNINIFYNPISDISNMEGLMDLKNATIGRNNLTFKDLLWTITYPDAENVFSFFTMNNVEVENAVIDKFAFETHTFSMPIDSFVNDITYYWYHDDILIDSTDTHNYTINSLNESQSGTWHVEWKINSAFPKLNELVMKSENWTLTVNSCQTIQDLDIDINSECEAAIFTLLSSTVTNPSNTFNFVLLNTITGDNKTLVLNQPVSVPHGEYQVISTDSNACNTSFTSNFLATEPVVECDRYFTPNDDGENDEFYIDLNGSVKIYNSTGLLVRTLNGPGYWNGKDDNNLILGPDLYLIQNDDGSIKVSLLY